MVGKVKDTLVNHTSRFIKKAAPSALDIPLVISDQAYLCWLFIIPEGYNGCSVRYGGQAEL